MLPWQPEQNTDKPPVKTNQDYYIIYIFAQNKVPFCGFSSCFPMLDCRQKVVRYTNRASSYCKSESNGQHKNVLSISDSHQEWEKKISSKTSINTSDSLFPKPSKSPRLDRLGYPYHRRRKARQCFLHESILEQKRASLKMTMEIRWRCLT